MIINNLMKIKNLREEGGTWEAIFLRGLDYIGIKTLNKTLAQNFKIMFFFRKTRYLNKKRHIFAKPSKSILIVETGVLGDTMLVVNAFRNLANYCAENDYEFVLVCSSTMKKIYQKYAGIATIKYICFGNRDNITYSEYKKIIEELNTKKYEYIILRDGNPLGFLIAGTLEGEHRMYYSYDINMKKKVQKKLAYKIFNEIVEYDVDTFIPNIWKDILKKVGGGMDYITEVGRISVSKDDIIKYRNIIPEREYVLFCPEASIRSKSIDIERCNQIIRLLKKYNKMVVVSTNARDLRYTEELEKIVRENEVVSYLGNTNFEEFVSLVSQSRMMIGCDSGSVHLAAGLAVPCIVLTGYWDSIHFFPYVMDRVADKNTIPICIYPEPKPDCAYCRERGCLHETPECRESIREKFAVKCLADIDIKKISAEIDRILNEQG